MRDIYFDSPDPSRADVPHWAPIKHEMTAEQLKDECSEGKSLPRAPAYYARAKRQGTRGADTMYGGRESTTLVARGGNDILLGASGNDKLFGGPGRDLISGGPGSDTIVDRRGRTRVSTGTGGRGGPDVVDVRDGKGHDRVLCGHRKAIVRADPGDRVRHCGG
jgi:hypothetical protein